MSTSLAHRRLGGLRCWLVSNQKSSFLDVRCYPTPSCTPSDLHAVHIAPLFATRTGTSANPYIWFAAGTAELLRLCAAFHRTHEQQATLHLRPWTRVERVGQRPSKFSRCGMSSAMPDRRLWNKSFFRRPVCLFRWFVVAATVSRTDAARSRMPKPGLLRCLRRSNSPPLRRRASATCLVHCLSPFPHRLGM